MFNLPETIEYSDICLIQPSMSHIKDVLYIFQDEEVVQYLRNSKFTEEAQAGKYIEKLIHHNHDNNSKRWDRLIYHTSKKRVIGHIGLADMDIEGFEGPDNIRYFVILHRLMWSENYAFQASIALISHLHIHHNNQFNLFAHCPKANTRANKMLQRQFFTLMKNVDQAYGPKMNDLDANVYFKNYDE